MVKTLSKYLILAALPLMSAGLPTPAVAQSSAKTNTADLQDALRRIARNSNDSSALADAGLAALGLGDTRAAIGFLAKANDIYPKSGRVKAGLARALLIEQNPFGAIRYFDEAIANGVTAKDIAVDRGLAYDLIGRNADAQKDYALALQHGQSDLLLSRYAISLGISGDIEGAEAQLNPLLLKSDRDAWRNRAFILAMNGQKKEANKIASQTMRKKMAKAIKPFFDRMPKLTAAQKAAAVHFGHFPASENIGVDVASVRLAANSAVRGGDGADAGLIPVGEPLGADVQKPRVLAMPDTSPRRRPGSKSSDEKKRQIASRPEANGKMPLARRTLPTPTNARPLVKPVVDRPNDPVTQTAPAAKTQSASPGFETAIGGTTEKAGTQAGASSSNSGAKTSPLVSESVTRKVDIGDVKAPADSNEKISKKPVQLVTFDLADAGSSASSPNRSASSDNAAATAAPRRPLSDIIGAIAIPETEKETAVVPVDLAAITPARAKPTAEKPAAEKVEAAPPPPENPKRYWVQIATGSNLRALKYDYERMAEKNSDLFAGKSGWTSPWGKTRRLVVGPFDDFSAAKKFEAGFRKDGGDGFAWVSADGTKVNKLN
ncbi:SPOR domain-containing protein [Parasphingorhabdus cellanae]|uniref:SPOR domain-containing protein n=1 Tax=Parasphingorhabdus cellanae TaxID=2806553 RepID=A0ABX7T622_9SPHN|nr:SPOR domain-containing protein [Parasphingorhabdus cellanae]QTD55572.1 SPOR domain-containing protein [Parasphingorhabdus cellanae]